MAQLAQRPTLPVLPSKCEPWQGQSQVFSMELNWAGAERNGSTVSWGWARQLDELANGMVCPATQHAQYCSGVHKWPLHAGQHAAGSGAAPALTWRRQPMCLQTAEKACFWPRSSQYSATWAGGRYSVGLS